MMRIFIEDSFDSAHWLPNVPDGHKCKSMHGHTYRIRLEIAGEIGKVSGWVMDYAEVKAKWDSVKVRIDHKNLNQIPGLENSTCERVAEWIRRELDSDLPGLVRIELRETEHCGVVLDCE